MNNNEIAMKDRYTKVCLCKSISRATIKDSIRNGARTLEDVKRKTRATTGSCNGNRCSFKIEDLIKGYKNEWS